MSLMTLAVVILVLALLLLWRGSRQQIESGLPVGRVIYADTSKWGRVEKPLYDSSLGLTGRPDYLVQQKGAIIPVEVKSGWAPDAPYPGHLFQLAVYCLLVERSEGVRPPYGLIRYRNRTFAVDYTSHLQERLLALIEEVRQDERRREVARSHEEPARCARCGYRGICDQRL
jgi:CRISPR-associated exonuclease Cas4